MTRTGGSRSRSVLALVLACVCTSVALVVAIPAGAASGPTLVGPVLSRAETANITWVRDGGYSLPLPNGKDFWIFGDSPRYEWKSDRWRITSFIYGSTAAQRKFTPGKPLDGPLDEVWVGHPKTTTKPPVQFLPSPALYMPDGSGRSCTRANGGSKTEAVRWATGVALMPDRTNILIPYVEVCVLGESGYTSEGWGFALFNYKTFKFTVKPTAVVRAQRTGAAMESRHVYGSPIIVGKKVTFYSWACCGSGSAIYATTVNATVAALKNPASYAPQPIPNLPPTYNLHVAAKSKTHSRFTMYQLRSDDGDYAIYSAPAPTGPWSQVGTGALPRCDQGPRPCRSFALRPELSPAKRLIVSYYLFSYGPAIATKHPAPDQHLPHVVVASLPCNC